MVDEASGENAYVDKVDRSLVAKVDGMDDHIVLPTTHTLMMNNPLVIAQALNFLRHGRFDHELTLRDLLRRVLGS